MNFNLPAGDFRVFYVNTKNGDIHAEKLVTGPVAIELTTESPLIWIKKVTPQK